MIYGSHFVYRNQDSRNYELVLCNIGGGSLENINVSTMTSQYADIPQQLFKPVYDVNYDGSLTFSINVSNCKGETYTRKQTQEILKWLSVRHYDWITFYDNDEIEACYYCCPQTIAQKKYGGDVYGFEIEFVTNSPLAWSPIYSGTILVVGSSNTIIALETDEKDYVYPYLEITKNGAGDITIENMSDIDIINKTDSYVTTIQNCLDNEKIIMDCQSRVIVSSDQINHKFFKDDFNFRFVRFVPGVNNLNITGDCAIVYKYRVPIKVGEY